MIDNIQTIPHDQEAEQAILGSILYDPSIVDEIFDRINPENFYLPAHQFIYDAMSDLIVAENPIDEITLGDILKSRSQLEECGGFDYIGSLVDCSSEAKNIGKYIEIVLGHYQKREVMLLASNSSRIARDPGTPASVVINDSLSKLTELSESLHSESELKPVNEIMLDVFQDLEKVSETQDEITGYATGFVDLDKLTSGLQPSDLVILGARPSMGKTALALNIAEYITTREKIDGDVLIFSYEMSRNQLVLRMASSMARVDSKNLRTGNIPQDEWDKLAMAADQISRMPLYIDDSIPALDKMVAIAKKHSKKRKIVQIVVDYIQLIPIGKKNGTRQEDVSEISRTLKLLAKQLDCNVLALSQLNRALEQRGDKRPKLSDLRESGALEQDSDIIMFIYRDECYNEDSADKGTAELLIEKHRNGPTGKIRLAFKGKYTKFANFTDSYDYNRG